MRLHEAQHILSVIVIKGITPFALEGAVINTFAHSAYRQCKRITATMVRLFFLHTIACTTTNHEYERGKRMTTFPLS